MADARLSHCGDLVRRFDHDRYLTCLLAPAGRREDLFALYAFNVEVARIAEVVRESALGHMRLQWWRDTLAEIHGGRMPHHPVAEPLAAAIARHGLDRADFDRLLSGREADLAGAPPATLAALEDYAEATSARLLYLSLQVLGARTRTGAAAGREIGVAWALCGLLRAVAVLARQRRLYLPTDLCDAEGLDVGDLFEVRSSPALTAVAAQVAARAADRLRAGRAVARQVPTAALPALGLAVLTERALGRLARAGFDPFQPAVQRPDPSRLWRLTWAKLRRRY
jgi:phytoene synthase